MIKLMKDSTIYESSKIKDSDKNDEHILVFSQLLTPQTLNIEHNWVVEGVSSDTQAKVHELFTEIQKSGIFVLLTISGKQRLQSDNIWIIKNSEMSMQRYSIWVDGVKRRIIDKEEINSRWSFTFGTYSDYLFCLNTPQAPLRNQEAEMKNLKVMKVCLQ